MNKLSADEFDAFLRSSFDFFLRKCFQELHANTEFLPNWHLEEIEMKLEETRSGTSKRLIINVPPRSLKSVICSVAFPAWVLGHDPSARIICVSYGQDLADKHARDTRTIMSSKWYRRLFATRLSSEKQAVQEFVTTAQGFRLATSIGGTVTGRGADYIIIDDPLKPEEAFSDGQRQAVNDYFDHTLYSRLDDKKKGRFILVMQRLHEDDLVGHVLEKEKWNVAAYPAIAEQEEKHVIKTPFGTYVHIRKAGEALHPARESLEELANIRRTTGEYNFAGQYQQAPAPLGGGIVKPEWFKRYKSTELPEKFDQIIQSWDTANKATELSDYSVCTTWGVVSQKCYLLSVYRKRLNYPDLKRAVVDQAGLYKPTVILIEDKASGIQLIQELTVGGLHAVKKYEPEADKVMRMNAQTAAIENGFVFIPEAAHWLGIYLQEMSTFPKGRYDDQVDSTSQALSWLKNSASASAVEWLNYYDRLIVGSNFRKVRIKAPPGIGPEVYFGNKRRRLDDDGCVEVDDEDDMRLLLANGWKIVG